MSVVQGVRGLHWTTFLLAAISLSLGWGIRGNFGHEYGAMIPGALTAIAVCLLSGREDWRARVGYFAFFGALGWGFGGAISYMQVISYTHSAHLSSQVWGFGGLFLIGFLWAGMGGAGTAFPAVADREQLTRVFRPMLWIFTAWAVGVVLMAKIETWESAFDATWQRHESPFYWFDADWREALIALVAVCLFDLWERHKHRHAPAFIYTGVGLIGFLGGPLLVFIGLRFQVGPEPLWEVFSYFIAAYGLALLFMGAVFVFTRLGFAGPLFSGIGGGIIGLILQKLFGALHLYGDSINGWLVHCFLHYQADVAYMAEQGVSREQLVVNWPQFFVAAPQHVGWILGTAAAITLYFIINGRFSNGASLFAYMAGGWLLSFIIFPTLLDWHLTPPRSDDWAGILGVFIGTMIWCYRNGLVPIVYASLISGIVGGLGFSGAAFIKVVLLSFGNPNISQNRGELQAFAHWQSANWHSFLEQSYGFINGLGIALAIGLLALRKGRVFEDKHQRPWTAVFAVGFVLFGLTWLNARKNVETWVGEYGNVPGDLKAPLLSFFEFSAMTWFNLTWILITVVVVCLMKRHKTRPIELIPVSWVGKGQLLYLVFLWMVVIMNFERALPAFAEGRMITEWVIFINAIIATGLIMVLPIKDVKVPAIGQYDYSSGLFRIALALFLAFSIAFLCMTSGVRAIYGDDPVHNGIKKRFGTEAEWRIRPLVKGQKHS